MPRIVGIGKQNFERIIQENIFYVDKTAFIKEWWESHDDVTLITRPRRFGKTLTLSMVEQFFSVDYANCKALFKGLSIWQEESYQNLQGSFPILSLSFANIKENTFSETKKKICQLIKRLYNQHDFLLNSNLLNEKEKEQFHSITDTMEDYIASSSLNILSEYLSRYYKKRVIILLDEYDTPMQEAYVYGYWQELISFTRNLFNSTFKTNPYMERALITGITRISKESIFSDLNNLKIISTTSNEYADSFGFTEQEVFAALNEYGQSDKKQSVKDWYDGFTFGSQTGIYNPWSIINYLDTGILQPYWANTSSNSLIGKLIQEGNENIKETMEDLLTGKSLTVQIDEQIIYNQLDDDENAIWSLLLASGYLKVKSYQIGATEYEEWAQTYELGLTNFEVKVMFQSMIRSWFKPSYCDYNYFVKALLANDVEAMNYYMNRVSLSIFSFFDTGRNPSKTAEPERFYHGFLLGLIVDLQGRYQITSNRESGFGRYDVMLEPLKPNENAILIEFKVRNPQKEDSLEKTVQVALAQIEEKNYAAALTMKGISTERIHKCGFAFEGKQVLIG